MIGNHGREGIAQGLFDVGPPQSGAKHLLLEPVDDDLRVRSVAGLFAEAIGRIHEGTSVSSLFDGVDPTLGPPQPRLPFVEPPADASGAQPAG